MGFLYLEPQLEMYWFSVNWNAERYSEFIFTQIWDALLVDEIVSCSNPFSFSDGGGELLFEKALATLSRRFDVSCRSLTDFAMVNLPMEFTASAKEERESDWNTLTPDAYWWVAGENADDAAEVHKLL